MTLRASSLGGTVRLVCRLRADRPEAAAPRRSSSSPRRPPRRESLSLLLSSLRRSPLALARPGPLAHSRNTHSLTGRRGRALSRAQHASRTRDHWPRAAADTSLWELSFFFFFPLSFLFKEFLSACLCPCLASASRPLGCSLSLSRVCSRANSSSSSSRHFSSRLYYRPLAHDMVSPRIRALLVASHVLAAARTF